MVKISQKERQVLDLTLKSLISNKIEVVSHSNSNLVGLKGVIVNETSNFFEVKLNNSDEIKKILKNTLIFRVEIEDKIYEINSEILKNSLSVRIKKFK